MGLGGVGLLGANVSFPLSRLFFSLSNSFLILFLVVVQLAGRDGHPANSLLVFPLEPLD
jgi:hypothetical protein